MSKGKMAVIKYAKLAHNSQQAQEGNSRLRLEMTNKRVKTYQNGKNGKKVKKLKC